MSTVGCNYKWQVLVDNELRLKCVAVGCIWLTSVAVACDRDYLVELREYLTGFLHRTKPLLDVEAQLSKARETFATDWEAGSAPGWADRGSTQVTAEAAAGKLDVDAFDTVEELETIGAYPHSQHQRLRLRLRLQQHQFPMICNVSLLHVG